MTLYRVSNKVFEVFFECLKDAYRFAHGQSISVGLEIDQIDVIPKQQEVPDENSDGGE